MALIYFDNGATTLKPQCVIDAVCNYLTNYSGNAHRGDYDLSHDVDTQFEKTRDLVAKLINCDRKRSSLYIWFNRRAKYDSIWLWDDASR